MKKKEYVPPKMEVTVLLMEECLATASDPTSTPIIPDIGSEDYAPNSIWVKDVYDDEVEW